jgi:hypothetical protein
MAKLNIECIRDIMLALEDKPYKETYDVSTLHEHLPQYSNDELEYCCYKLYEAGFLELSVTTVPMTLFLTYLNNFNSLQDSVGHR